MISTLFISDLTTVDHAVLLPNGGLLGNSFNVSVKVTGKVTVTEKVVEDFGSIKKRIKAFIDDKEEGFDHKLWIPIEHDRKLFVPGISMYHRQGEDWGLNVPKNAVKFVPFDTDPGSFRKNTEISLEHYLAEKMPNLSFKVQTNQITRLPFTTLQSEAPSMFRYTHGLRDSTSWGCQNIAHGHLSFLHLRSNSDTCGTKAKRLQADIAKHLNNAIFIRRENVLDQADSKFINISYYSRDRGLFQYYFKKELNHYLILESETTIEYLAEFVHDFWRKDMVACEVGEVYVSEGLMKGAVVEVM